MGRLLHKLADSFGYQLKRKKLLYNSQNHIKSLIEKHQINLVIDVGANAGQFASKLRASGYQGQIISFEPVISTFQKLSENCKNDAKWSAVNLALGAQQGELRINISELSDFNSILAPNDFAKSTWQKLATKSTEIIKVETLDQFATAHNLLDKRIFLKLDTQGYDLEAFKGAVTCIPAIKILQSEVSFIQIYEGMPNFRESMDTYLSYGFQVSAFFPVSEKPNGAAIEMDCIFVKTDV